jgi:hypothetical protein
MRQVLSLLAAVVQKYKILTQPRAQEAARYAAGTSQVTCFTGTKIQY